MGGVELGEIFVELAVGLSAQATLADAAAGQRGAVFLIAVYELLEEQSSLSTFSKRHIGHRRHIGLVGQSMSQDFSGGP